MAFRNKHPDFPELDYDPVWELDTAYYLRNYWGDYEAAKKLVIEIATDLTTIGRKHGEAKVS